MSGNLLKNKSIEVLSLSDTNFSDEEVRGIALHVWPKAWLQCGSDADWQAMWAKYRSYQFVCLLEGTLVATFYTAPLPWQDNFDQLADEGWEWAVRASAGAEPDSPLACALSMSVLPAYRGLGLSKLILTHAKKVLAAEGFQYLVAPVRPMQKTNYPLIDMASYLGWVNEEGLVFDGWVRVHTQLGASIIKVCSRSMVIAGSASEWEAWTGLPIKGPGDHIIPHALNPVTFTRQEDGKLHGVYVEPNVWLAHKLG